MPRIDTPAFVPLRETSAGKKELTKIPPTNAKQKYKNIRDLVMNKFYPQNKRVSKRHPYHFMNDPTG